MKITTEDIQVGFHARQILKGISIESKDKELVGIIGPNGSGKSTLLKCIYRILKPDAGYYFAITVAAKGNLQGQRRHDCRQLRHDPFLGRQGKNDAQRNIGNLRQRND